ncbi:MAG TPA: hypothetical protein VLE69_02560 [Candidatus Saccharimonadales bacterium]|nr:hypothetical protein [Candidatus Saccharimonadales bacterium]
MTTLVTLEHPFTSPVQTVVEIPHERKTEGHDEPEECAEEPPHDALN